MKINWDGVNSPARVFFQDLQLNETFRIASLASKGAIYAKTRSEALDEEFMYEVATGKLWAPTASQVERIDVEVSIRTGKPRIYST